MFCSESVDSDLPSLSARIDETDMYFEVTGLGAAAVGDSTTIAEARRNAESVAYFQAVEILSEAIQGVAVQGDMRLRDLAIGEGSLSQLIKARLEQIRQVGATQFEEQEDGSWIAAYTIIYQKENAQKIANAIGSGEHAELTSYTDNTVLPQNRDYSGIILDVRYVSGFNTFLAPKIARDGGSVLFSVRDIEPHILIESYGVPVFAIISDAVRLGDVGQAPLKIVPVDFKADTGVLIIEERDARIFETNNFVQKAIKTGKLALII